jgi:hypothetical protein
LASSWRFGPTASIPRSSYAGRFPPNFSSSGVSNEEFGRFEFNFSSCDSARLDYSLPSGFGSGTLRIRFSSCNEGTVDHDLGTGFGRGSMRISRLTQLLGVAFAGN